MPPISKTDTTAQSVSSVTMNQALKLVVLVSALLALLFVAMLLSNESKQRTGVQVDTGEQSAPTVSTRTVANDQIPGNIPTDLPDNSATLVVKNEIVTINGIQEAVRHYQSSESATVNFSAYQSYFNNNGWEILNQLNQADQKLISAKQGYRRMNVAIITGANGQDTLVKINYSEAN